MSGVCARRLVPFKSATDAASAPIARSDTARHFAVHIRAVHICLMNSTVEGIAKMPRLCRSAAFVVAAVLWLSGSTAWAADAIAGKARAQACVVCHGALGLSTLPDAPNLAAQPAIYLSAQLRAFRNGERRHEVMNVIAKPLTDDDIDNLAAWFASVRIEAHAPQ